MNKNIFAFHVSTKFLVFLIISAALFALFAEEYPLPSSPFLNHFVESVLEATGLSRAAAKSSFPNAAKAYYVFAVPQVMAFFWVMFRWARKENGKNNGGILFIKPEKFFWFHRAILIAFLPIWTFALVGGWIGFVGENSRLFKIGTSLQNLLLLGWIFPAGAAVLIFFLVASLKKSIFGDL